MAVRRWWSAGVAGGVAGGVVDVVVVAEAPDDAAPGAGEDADGVLVRAAAGARGHRGRRPRGVGVAANVGHRCDRVSEAVVAGPAEAGALGFARFDGDGRLTAVGAECGAGAVAVAAVADFGQDRGRADGGLGVAEQRAERRAVDVVGERGADLAGRLGDPRNDRGPRARSAGHHRRTRQTRPAGTPRRSWSQARGPGDAARHSQNADASPVVPS